MTERAKAPPTSGDDKLAELSVATGRTVPDLMSEAVDRLSRIYVGDPDDGPTEPTAPFSKLYSALPAEIVVRQVTPATFELREPFRYAAGGRRFDMLMGDISDFASVPRFLTWLIPRYGQHTMAALLHDHLQHHLVTERDPRPDDPERVTSEQADTIFREALSSSRVPFLRRWVMWTAVSLRTIVKSGVAGVVAVLLWTLVFVVLGIAWPTLFLIASASPTLGWPLPVLLAAATFLLPVVLCWLWWRWWRVGLISGLTLAVITLPCVLAILAAGFYFGVEALGRAALKERTALLVLPPDIREEHNRH